MIQAQEIELKKLRPNRGQVSGFASQVAQSVRKYNYKISEKQAYVIAKAATEGKIGRLYNPDKTIRIVFRKWNPKTKKLE